MKTMDDFKGTKREFFDEYPFVNSDALVVRTSNGYVCEVKAPDTFKKEEAESNAKLFAASKRLLETLIEVRGHMNAYMPESIFSKVDEAINSAL